MEKPNCYECKYREQAGPFDAHSKCVHPLVADDVKALACAVFPKLRPPQLNVSGNEYGIAEGWFMWPINFDPAWLETCEGFERKEVENESTKECD